MGVDREAVPRWLEGIGTVGQAGAAEMTVEPCVTS